MALDVYTGAQLRIMVPNERVSLGFCRVVDTTRFKPALSRAETQVIATELGGHLCTAGGCRSVRFCGTAETGCGSRCCRVGRGRVPDSVPAAAAPLVSPAQMEAGNKAAGDVTKGTLRAAADITADAIELAVEEGYTRRMKIDGLFTRGYWACSMMWSGTPAPGGTKVIRGASHAFVFCA